MTNLRSELEWLAETFDDNSHAVESEWGNAPRPCYLFEEDRKRAKAIFARLEWQPIETAPEEGVFLISDGAMVCYASREKGDYWDIAGYKWPAPEPAAKLGMSHWMPLPDPPER